MADLYYTAGGLEKKEWRTDRQRTDREQRTDTPITEATLIPMDCWVEQTNNINHRQSYNFRGCDTRPLYDC